MPAKENNLRLRDGSTECCDPLMKYPFRVSGLGREHSGPCQYPDGMKKEKLASSPTSAICCAIYSHSEKRWRRIIDEVKSNCDEAPNLRVIARAPPIITIHDMRYVTRMRRPFTPCK